MIERPQFDMGIEGQRVASMSTQGFSIDEQRSYVERQLVTDIGERVDRAESHYVYELRDGEMFAPGFSEPFTQVMERGIIQGWHGSRERAEVETIKLIQAMPDGSVAFWPSRPDGKNYKKNYLDVAKRVENEIHMVRYFSDLSAEECREKIIAINPAYQEVLPQHPTDVDFFLNPVFVPKHLDINLDDLAQFVLGEKKGMKESEFQRIISENSWLITATVNTLVENPGALSEHETHQKALYAGVRKFKDGDYQPTYSIPRMEIQYLAEQKETLGGGGCGSGACSPGETGLIDLDVIAKSLGLEDDSYGRRVFRCKCGAINIRWERDKLLSKCGGCSSKDVLPPSLQLQNFQPGLTKEQ